MKSSAFISDVGILTKLAMSDYWKLLLLTKFRSLIEAKYNLRKELVACTMKFERINRVENEW